MNNVFKLALFALLASLGFFLQIFNIIKIGSINPNIILVFFASLAAFYDRKKFIIIATPIFAGILVWTLNSMPFWIESVVLVGVVVAVVIPFSFKFTGNNFIDSLLLVFGLTFLYYLPFWLIGAQAFDWFVLGEALYNMILASIFSFAVVNIDYTIEKI